MAFKSPKDMGTFPLANMRLCIHAIIDFNGLVGLKHNNGLKSPDGCTISP